MNCLTAWSRGILERPLQKFAALHVTSMFVPYVLQNCHLCLFLCFHKQFKHILCFCGWFCEFKPNLMLFCKTGYYWFTCQTVLAWWQQSWNFLVAAIHGVGYKPLSKFLFQDLYGRRSHHPPDLCLNSSFDAIFENPDGIIYVLKGKNIYICEYGMIIGLDVSRQQRCMLLLVLSPLPIIFTFSYSHWLIWPLSLSYWLLQSFSFMQ